MGKSKNQVYCAFCKIPRSHYAHRHIGWMNVLLAAVTALLAMYIAYGSFNPKVMVIFVVFLVAAELFTQIRWRLSTTCPHCGFDPVLYLRDHRLARDKVIARLKKRKASADYLLSAKDPLAKLPKRKAPLLPETPSASPPESSP